MKNTTTKTMNEVQAFIDLEKMMQIRADRVTYCTNEASRLYMTGTDAEWKAARRSLEIARELHRRAVEAWTAARR
jgi:hypothetical protein